MASSNTPEIKVYCYGYTQDYVLFEIIAINNTIKYTLKTNLDPKPLSEHFQQILSKLN